MNGRGGGGRVTFKETISRSYLGSKVYVFTPEKRGRESEAAGVGGGGVGGGGSRRRWDSLGTFIYRK